MSFFCIIAHVSRLSRILERKLKSLVRDNNLDEGKLDGLLGMEFREVDDDAAILIETKWVLLLERTCKNLCENAIALA